MGVAGVCETESRQLDRGGRRRRPGQGRRRDRRGLGHLLQRHRALRQDSLLTDNNKLNKIASGRKMAVVLAQETECFAELDGAPGHLGLAARTSLAREWPVVVRDILLCICITPIARAAPEILAGTPVVDCLIPAAKHR